MSKNKFNFGSGQELPGFNAIPENFNRPVVSHGKFTSHPGLGSPGSDFRKSKRPSKRIERIFNARFWKSFSKQSQSNPLVRQQSICLGGIRPSIGKNCKRFLEGFKSSAYQSKRTAGCSSNNQIPSKGKGDSRFTHRQSGSIQLSQQMGWKKKLFKSNLETPPVLLQGKANLTASELGSNSNAKSRLFDKRSQGPRGLHLKPKNFSKNSAFLQGRNHTRDRYVLYSQQQKIPKILLQIPPSQCPIGGCIENKFDGITPSLCESPMERHSSMDSSFATKPGPSVPHGDTPLGLHIVVAPINGAQKTQHKNFVNQTQLGSFYKLLGGKDAPNKMAPSLHDCIRELLQHQKIQKSSCDTFLKNLGSAARYDSAFRKLMILLDYDQGALNSATCSELAEGLLRLSEFSLTDARNAYSACLLLPGFGALRFSPLLIQVKKVWNVQVQKYATFWSPEKILARLAEFQGKNSRIGSM